MTKPILEEAIKAYTVKYLLAENLYMASMYHQNPTANCLAVLNDYSPRNVVQIVADRMMEQDFSIGTRFLLAMYNVNHQCLGHMVNPELAGLKNELLDLR